MAKKEMKEPNYVWTVEATGNNPNIYRGERFDFKKIIITISALLNSGSSATLHVFALAWWLEYSKGLDYEPHVDSYSAILRFISEEIQRAISPKVTVEYDDTIPDYDDPSREESNAMFTITGGTPPYSAFGQYYMQKDGEICPLEDSDYILPKISKKPIVNIGPRTEQTEYIETFADLDYGIFALRAIRNRYPYAVLYIGVKEDGTVIDPRSVEETKKDITEAVEGYVKTKAYLGYRDHDVVCFNVDKIENIGVVQLILGGNYHYLSADYHDFYCDSRGLYTRDNFAVREFCGRSNVRKLVCTQYSLYELESPTRNLSFGRLKNLLEDHGIQWGDFETEFGISLLNDDGRYNLFAYLMNDTTEKYVCAPYIVDNKQKLSGHVQLWNSKERWFFERISDILDCIRAFNRLRSINIDGKKTTFQYFNFEDAKEAYLCACIYHDWASQRSPSINVRPTLFEIYCLPILHRGANGELVPEKNEVLGRLMKMYGLIDEMDISFARLQEKFGPKAICYIGGRPGDKYIKIVLPIGSRVIEDHNNSEGA